MSSNGIPYLSPKEFFKKYKLDKKNRISKGSYGIIYSVGVLYVVKEFIGDNSFLELAKELNIYASYMHPCIIRPIHWTIRKDKAYLAMPRGKDLTQAFNNDQVSIKQIVSDTLSAFAFLNSNGIAHGDIKPNNLIYDEKDGLVKVIDFGLAKRGNIGPDGQYYIKGLAYSFPYKDPEYVSNQENNINSDIFPLLMTYAYFVEPFLANFGAMYSYSTLQPGLNELFNRGTKFQEDRGSMQTLLDTAPDTLIVRDHVGILFEDGLLPADRSCSPAFTGLLHWIVVKCYEHDLESRSLFLILHLIHRLYNDLMILYKEDITKYQKKKQENSDDSDFEETSYYEYEDEKGYAYVIGAAAMTLIAYVNGDHYMLGKTWALEDEFIYDNQPDIVDFLHMKTMVDMLELTGGIISTTTYWDYAKSGEDLLPLLMDTLNCNYNPSKIRHVEGKSDKCIRVSKIFPSQQAFETFKSSSVNKFIIPIPIVRKSVQYHCDLNNRPDIKQILDSWGKIQMDFYEDMIPLLLHNRKALDQLPLDLAVEIFTFLFNVLEQREKRDPHSLEKFVLDNICGYKWRDEKDTILAKRVHPFHIFVNDEGKYVSLSEYDQEKKTEEERRKKEKENRQKEYLSTRQQRREEEEDRLVEEARRRREINAGVQKKKQGKLMNKLRLTKM
jgi:serine/threonine protein kinase